MEEYITHSRDETVALGRRLAAELAPGSLIAFTGGLGAGKTAFCQARPPGSSSTSADSKDAEKCDYLDMGAVVAAEWSENCADLLALENPIYINIDRLDETTRKITITRPGA